MSKKDQLRLWFHAAAFSRMQYERKKKKSLSRETQKM